MGKRGLVFLCLVDGWIGFIHGKGMMGKDESRRWVATGMDGAHWQADGRFLKRPALPPERD